MKEEIYRQGDVLLVRISNDPQVGLPSGLKDQTPEDRIVLAYGEVTGHAHALAEVSTKTKPEGKVKAFSATPWDASAERFIQVLETTALKHEEHDPVVLDKGVYKVVRQNEYSPEAIRQVAD